MTLIHTYIYKEVILLTTAIIGVLTFLLVAINMFKVMQWIMYTDLPIWITVKFILLGGAADSDADHSRRIGWRLS